jgi:hypothetical protein
MAITTPHAVGAAPRPLGAARSRRGPPGRRANARSLAPAIRAGWFEPSRAPRGGGARANAASSTPGPEGDDEAAANSVGASASSDVVAKLEAIKKEATLVVEETTTETTLTTTTTIANAEVSATEVETSVSTEVSTSFDGVQEGTVFKKKSASASAKTASATKTTAGMNKTTGAAALVDVSATIAKSFKEKTSAAADADAAAGSKKKETPPTLDAATLGTLGTRAARALASGAGVVGRTFLSKIERDRVKLGFLETFTKATGVAVFDGERLAETDPELDAQIKGLIDGYDEDDEEGVDAADPSVPKTKNPYKSVAAREAVADFVRAREGTLAEEIAALRSANDAMQSKMDEMEFLQDELTAARRETNFARANIKVMNIGARERERLEAEAAEARAEGEALADALREEMRRMAKEYAEREAALDAAKRDAAAKADEAALRADEARRAADALKEAKQQSAAAAAAAANAPSAAFRLGGVVGFGVRAVRDRRPGGEAPRCGVRREGREGCARRGVRREGFARVGVA